jgi:Asp-tRNA(Asn)/Glu-tRNA(Gln) amidotransferase B subunit
LNWALVTDPVLIDSVVSSVLAEHPKQVHEFMTTNATRIFDFMVGVALKKLQFKVSPTKVADAMKQQLLSTRKL